MKRKNLDFIGFPNYEVDTDGEIYNIKTYRIVCIRVVICKLRQIR